MKTTYKVKRGYVWHVIHETKTQKAAGPVWTLCGSYYDTGERSDKTPTCPGCLKMDNPLTMSSRALLWLETNARGETFSLSRGALERLVKSDYVDHERTLTRRGKLIVQDFRAGAVPMADVAGIVHARKPLDLYPLCERNGRLLYVNEMTTERYAKLQLVRDQVMITCLQCLAKEDLRDYVH